MPAVVALTPVAAARVLLVEDSASDAVLIEKTLAKAMTGGFHLRREVTLANAIKALTEAAFDIVLLDLSLPDSLEFDGLQAIQNFAPKLPVVILTSYEDDAMALKAVEHGAQDYLFKNTLDGPAMCRAMQYAVQRKQFESSLITQANFDPLTGLANRALFESRLDMALARMQRAGAGIGVFFLDLDRFKPVNDRLGHAAGDRLLQQVAERIKQSLRPYDTAARFGGDEFALLVEGVAQSRDCAVIAHKIVSLMGEPFHLSRKKVEVGISIGIAVCFPGEPSTPTALMRQADEAMYEAKAVQQSNYRFYTARIQEEAGIRLALENDLRLAPSRGELLLHYQPKIDLQNGRTTGAEVLARWNHPQRGLLLPSEFMAVAEETGMAADIGWWVLEAACRDLDRWRKAKLPPIKLSVNVSAAQLDDPSLAGTLAAMLRHYRVPPATITIEVPSSVFLEHTEARAKTLTALRDLGIALHLDHFGTTAISLAALQSCSFEALKIAPSLTSNLNEPTGMLPLVQAIMDIAGRFNMGVVATGIENDWQKAFFKKRACREGQGFALCRPVSADALPDWLNRDKS